MKESNRFCVFAFKRHYLTTKQNKYKIRLPKFKTEAYCTLPSCNIKANLTMQHGNREVQVTYTGTLKHKIKGEKNARRISGNERQQLKNKFQCGKEVMKEYQERLNAKSGDDLVAGNFDGVGNTRSVLQKISSESRQQNREDKDLFESLKI